MGIKVAVSPPLEETSQQTKARTLVRLLSWLSPAFPVGSFSYSHGLEQAIADHVVHDRDTVLNWIGSLLTHGAGWTDAVLLKEAYLAARDEDGRRLQDISDLAEALCPSLERLRETRDQGHAFLAACVPWAAASASPPPSRRDAPYPVAVGLFGAEAGTELSDVLLAYLHAFASNLVTIAVRAVPLGQTAGVYALAALEGVLLATAAKAALSTLDDLGGCAFASDIASMRHETLQPRLYIS
jgi:urease accessory protein